MPEHTQRRYGTRPATTVHSVHARVRAASEEAPQLGKRGLYRTIGGQQYARTREMAMLWVLNYADGEHTLLDIAERAGLPFEDLRQAADVLLAHQLLADVTAETASEVGPHR